MNHEEHVAALARMPMDSDLVDCLFRDQGRLRTAEHLCINFVHQLRPEDVVGAADTKRSALRADVQLTSVRRIGWNEMEVPRVPPPYVFAGSPSRAP